MKYPSLILLMLTVMIAMVCVVMSTSAQGMGDVGHTITTTTKDVSAPTSAYPNTKFNYNRIADTTEAIGREIYDHTGSSFLGTMRMLSITPHLFYSGDSIPTDVVSAVDLIIEQENVGDGAQLTAVYSGTGPIRMLIDDSSRVSYTANHVADRLYTGWTDDQSKSFWVIVLTPDQFNQLARSHKIDVDFQGKQFTLKNANTSWIGIARLVERTTK